MKKARMNISQFRFILFNLKIFGETVATLKYCSNIVKNHVKWLACELPCNLYAKKEQYLHETLTIKAQYRVLKVGVIVN